MAAERVKERLRRATRALDDAGVSYAVVGGNAVAEWVAHMDEGAVRNTRDVDILIRRSDFDSVRAALEGGGFVHHRILDLDTFIDGAAGRPSEGVHILYSGEKVNSGDQHALPEVGDSERGIDFQVANLQALLRMKLIAWRDKDRTHPGFDRRGPNRRDVASPVSLAIGRAFASVAGRSERVTAGNLTMTATEERMMQAYRSEQLDALDRVTEELTVRGVDHPMLLEALSTLILKVRSERAKRTRKKSWRSWIAWRVGVRPLFELLQSSRRESNPRPGAYKTHSRPLSFGRRWIRGRMPSGIIASSFLKSPPAPASNCARRSRSCCSALSSPGHRGRCSERNPSRNRLPHPDCAS